MTALHGMAKCLIRSGRLEEASSKSKRAIELIEKLRTSVADLGLRRSYFATARQQYALYIDILMQLQREREAFGISELARARTLLDSIGEIGVSLSEGADPAQLERATSLRALLLRASERYSDLVGAGEAEAEEAAKLAEQIQRYITELDRIEGQMRAQNSRYAARGTLEPLELEDIQRDLLDDKSILLEYAIGDENIYLWVVTKTGFNPITLSTRRSEIEKKALRARELLASPTSDPSETAAVTADLSRILLPKEAADLLGERRMVIVDEGILQYLPFGALPSPQSATTASPVPLIRDHEIVNLPSASTLAAIRQAPLRRAPTKTVAVFANPVYGAASGLPALPGTRKEWEAISEVAPKNGQFGFLGDAATREAVMNQSLKDYKIIHFATHAILDEKQPDLSRLVLSLDKNRAQQDVLFLRDIYNLRLSAELVVLSACDTGVGKDIQGEGLISLVRGFMYSGTPRVVASLWKVDDKSTTALMREFYTHYLKNGKNGLKPSDALRQAQISLSQKENLTPYDWAAFQLFGDWN
jgi:CHAT domain-containing protein